MHVHLAAVSFNGIGAVHAPIVMGELEVDYVNLKG